MNFLVDVDVTYHFFKATVVNITISLLPCCDIHMFVGTYLE